MTEPFVSIVIPCYNAAGTIRRTLKWVRVCGYSNYEVILVDDGSTDNTKEIFEKLLAEDSRLIVLHQKNSGVSVARNNGVKRATSDFIAFLDADDIFFKGCITERMKIFQLEESDDLLGVFCPAFILGEDLYPLQEAPLFNYSLPGNKLYFSSVAGSAFNPSSVIVKRAKFLELGGFASDLDSAEDYELWHRMMRSGGYFQKAPDCVVGWVHHPLSITHSNFIHHYRQNKKVITRIFGRIADKNCASEFEGGLGVCYYQDVLSKRALLSSIISALSKRHDDALSIAQDITPSYLRKLSHEELSNMLKLNVIRVLCKSEKLWPNTLWNLVRPDILPLFAELRKKINGSNSCLESVVANLDQLRNMQTIGVLSGGKTNPVDNETDQIDILSVELLTQYPDIVEMIYRMSSEMRVGLGWHYVLDIVWIIKFTRKLPRGSVILDAGAGKGLLQFILASMGYRIVSVDFADRTIPPLFASKFHIISVDPGTVYDNDYIRHLRREYRSSATANSYSQIGGESVSNLLNKSDCGTIIYYKSDISDMKLITNASIDCVVSVSALEHNQPDKIKSAVRELQRVLKPRHSMFITVSGAESKDWYHEQSKGWCFKESTLIDLFFLNQPQSNFCEYGNLLYKLKNCRALQEKLDSGYFRSGNNGMPWGAWQPQYQPVGIQKINRSKIAPSIRASGDVVGLPVEAMIKPSSHPTLEKTKIKAFVDTTNGCNLRCSFCTRSNKKIKFMSTDNFRLLLDKIVPIVDSLQLCCAWEYSIAPNAHEIIGVLGSRHIQTTTIYTNGQILPQRLAQKIIEAQINNLVFSVGEAHKETYERLRKRGNFERLLGNIERVNLLKDKIGAQLPKLCANLTLVNSNIQELPEFVDLAHQLKISEIRGRHLILNEGLNMDGEIIADKAHANAILETSMQRASAYGMAFNVPRYSDILSQKECTAPWRQLYISNNGDASVCPRIHIYEKIGNLFTQDLECVLTSPEMIRLQRQMKSRNLSNPVCSICLQNKESEQYINQGF